MTLEEAEIIGWIVSMADDGCVKCVSQLMYYLNRKFPEFHWEFGESKGPIFGKEVICQQLQGEELI